MRRAALLKLAAEIAARGLKRAGLYGVALLLVVAGAALTATGGGARLLPGQANVRSSSSDVGVPGQAVPDSATVNEDSGATAINVQANDIDPDGGGLITNPSFYKSKHGTVHVKPGRYFLTYRPNDDYCNTESGGRPDTFTYTLNGGSTTTVTVTVTCVNDAPRLSRGRSSSYVENAPAAIVSSTLRVTDVDSQVSNASARIGSGYAAGQDHLSWTDNDTSDAITLAGSSTDRTVVLTGTAPSIQYQRALRAVRYRNTSDAPSTTTRKVGFKATDTDGAVGSAATALVAITAVDDPGTAVNDTATVAQDSGANTIDVLANETDVDGGSKIVATTDGAKGTVAITNAGANLTYTPAAGTCGSDSFTYTLNGGSIGTVSVTVTCANEVPVANGDTGATDEDTTLSEDAAHGVLANDTDADGDPLTAVLVTGVSHGSLTLSPDGSYTYTPASNYNGSDSFTYKANDGSADSTLAATVTITINAVDDPPAAVADSAAVAEDAAPTTIDVLANDADSDGGPETISSTTDGAHGTVAIASSGADLTYAPAADFCGSDSFTYALNGGSTGTVALTVSCVNDPPVAAGDAAATNEDTTLSRPAADGVLANDSDAEDDPLTAKLVAGPAHAQGFQLGPDGSYSYTPASDYNGSDSFTYKANDGSADSTLAATVTITVRAVDDPPAAVADAATLAQGSRATTIDVLANDTDVDGGPEAVESKTNGSHGTVALASSGIALTYTPDAGFCGSDSFTYTLNGGSTGTVTVTVSCATVFHPRVVISHPRVVTNSSGAAIGLRCVGAGGRCAGTVELQATRLSTRIRKARATDGTPFSLAAGHRKSLRLPIPEASLEQIASNGRAIARVVARLENGTEVKRLITLYPPGERRRH